MCILLGFFHIIITKASLDSHLNIFSSMTEKMEFDLLFKSCKILLIEMLLYAFIPRNKFFTSMPHITETFLDFIFKEN